MSNDSDKRHRKVADMLPAEWDRRPISLAGEIRSFLQSVKDHGTEIDSGSGNGNADLWVTVQGVEYYINVRPSNAQTARDAAKST